MLIALFILSLRSHALIHLYPKLWCYRALQVDSGVKKQLSAESVTQLFLSLPVRLCRCWCLREDGNHHGGSCTGNVSEAGTSIS